MRPTDTVQAAPLGELRLGGPLTTLPALRALPTPWLDLERYSALLHADTWGRLVRFIHYTRSYERGLELGWLLLAAAERYAPNISVSHRDRQVIQIYSLILDALDRSDEWEEFLSAFEQLHRATRLTHGGYYSERSRAHHQARGASAFILESVPGGFKMHFLYRFAWRRDVIKRKLQRRVSGHHIRTDYHARQAELSEAELRPRGESFLSEFEAAGKRDRAGNSSKRT